MLIFLLFKVCKITLGGSPDTVPLGVPSLTKECVL